jgi:hypothetical protein
VIWPFQSMEVLCGFSKMVRTIGITGDRAGKLGENGEYWMGSVRVVWTVDLELHSCSPHLCRLRPASVWSE